MISPRQFPVVLGLLVLLVPASAYAGDGYTIYDVANIPAYCDPDTLVEDPPDTGEEDPPCSSVISPIVIDSLQGGAGPGGGGLAPGLTENDRGDGDGGGLFAAAVQQPPRPVQPRRVPCADVDIEAKQVGDGSRWGRYRVSLKRIELTEPYKANGWLIHSWQVWVEGVVTLHSPGQPPVQLGKAVAAVPKTGPRMVSPMAVIYRTPVGQWEFDEQLPAILPPPPAGGRNTLSATLLSQYTDPQMRTFVSFIKVTRQRPGKPRQTVDCTFNDYDLIPGGYDLVLNP